MTRSVLVEATDILHMTVTWTKDGLMVSTSAASAPIILRPGWSLKLVEGGPGFQLIAEGFDDPEAAVARLGSERYRTQTNLS